MACPYLIPTERLAGGGWLHPGRLPLGVGFAGKCNACGEPAPIAEGQLHECNLGYARDCPRLPASREWDALRFGISLPRDGWLTVQYVCEREHRPVEHGELEYELAAKQWTKPHPDPRVQRKAERYVESYLVKNAS